MPCPNGAWGGKSPVVLSAKGSPNSAPPLAIVVLGCRVHFAGEVLATGALSRRLDAAAAVYARYARYAGERDARTIVIVSGGRRRGPAGEADAMGRAPARRGLAGPA